MKLKCNTCDGTFDTVDIRFTKKCSNNCSFCIEQFSGIPGKETDVEKILESVLKTGTSEVLILGGEPFVEMEKLLELTNALLSYKITTYITTSLPVTVLKNYNIFQSVMNNIDGLNISLHSCDNDVNNNVYKNNNHNRIELMSKIVAEYPDKIRVCVNLIKGFIDTSTEVHNTLSFLNKIGVKNVKLNELCHSNEFVSFEKIMDIKLDSPYATGCYSRVLSDKYEGMRIELKRSCFITENSLKASVVDFIKVVLNKFIVKPLNNKFCVIYEDGTIKNNWITKGECNV